MRETQFYPVEFEVNKRATLNLDNKNFNLNARIDRIDKKPDTKEFKVIDYKNIDGILVSSYTNIDIINKKLNDYGYDKSKILNFFE